MGKPLFDKILEIKKYIDENIGKINDINQIIDKFEIDRQTFYEHFSIFYGKSPWSYILDKKMEKLVQLISQSHDNEKCFYYAHELGFHNASGLCNLIKRKTGLTFMKFRDQVLKNN